MLFYNFYSKTPAKNLRSFGMTSDELAEYDSSVSDEEYAISSSSESTATLTFSTSATTCLISGRFSGDLSQHFMAICISLSIPWLAPLFTTISASNISAVHSSLTALFTHPQRSTPFVPAAAECAGIRPVRSSSTRQP